MATYSQSYTTGAIANDADFRTRGKWFSDRLTDIGWAKTADTGQIDWSTVTKPAAGSTMAGYEIRKTNDGLTDVYLKIEYGTGNTASLFGMAYTFASASNGSGTLSGTVSTRTVLNTSTGTVTNTDYVSGTAGRFSLAHYVVTTITNTGFQLTFQRTTDANGSDTSEGFFAFSNGYSAAGRSQYVSLAGTVQTQRTGLGWTLMGSAPIPATVATVPVFPIYFPKINDFQLVRDVLAIPSASASGGSTHVISVLGSNRTYIAVWGGAATAINEASSMPANCSVCIRYE